MTELTREVIFHPGYDYREEDKDKPWGSRRGVHGLSIRFLLHGDEGTVQFVIYTNWLPTWVKEDTWGPRFDRPKSEFEGVEDLYPMGADVGHHWKTPTYEEETRMDCDILEQGFCYYDGSGLRAEMFLGVLVSQGQEAVWSLLEAEYHDLSAPSQHTAQGGHHVR